MLSACAQLTLREVFDACETADHVCVSTVVATSRVTSGAKRRRECAVWTDTQWWSNLSPSGTSLVGVKASTWTASASCLAGLVATLGTASVRSNKQLVTGLSVCALSSNWKMSSCRAPKNKLAMNATDEKQTCESLRHESSWHGSAECFVMHHVHLPFREELCWWFVSWGRARYFRQCFLHKRLAPNIISGPAPAVLPSATFVCSPCALESRRCCFQCHELDPLQFSPFHGGPKALLLKLH